MSKFPPIPDIQNGEEGGVVREKLNAVIDQTNKQWGLDGKLGSHTTDKNNPHSVKAPQVRLDPVLTPLRPDEQNVQDALEWLYRFFKNTGNDWHLDKIDGNVTVIQIKRERDSQFPLVDKDLEEAELVLNRDRGELWTKLSDGTIVKLGDDNLIEEAPLTGEIFGRTVSDTDPTVGMWHRISLATVSEEIPQEPTEGDLWVDTKNTMELYVYLEGQGWISMTGAEGGASGSYPVWITTDEVNNTLTEQALAREIEDDGTAFWRPIYSADVIGSELAQPMLDADGSVLRNQSDINQYLYQVAEAGGGSGDWDDIAGKPTEFPPEAHTHAISEIDELQGALDEASVEAVWANIAGKPDDYPPAAHTHPIEDITGLNGALNDITDDVDDLQEAVENLSESEMGPTISIDGAYTSKIGHFLGDRMGLRMDSLQNAYIPIDSNGAAKAGINLGSIQTKLQSGFFSQEVSAATFSGDGSKLTNVAGLDALEERIEEGEQIQLEVEQRVTQGEAKQTELEDKVDALEGKGAEHEWVYDGTNSNPRSGQFQIKDRGQQNIGYIDQGYYLYLSNSDRDGNPVNLARIVEGDVVRIKSTLGDEVAELKVLDHTGGQGAIQYTMIGGDMTRMFDAPYGFTLYSSFDPAGLATIDYVDERVATKLDLTGGTLSGNLTLDKRDMHVRGDNAQIFMETNSGKKMAELSGTGLISTNFLYRAFRTSGSVFEVTPYSGVTNLVIKADGSIESQFEMLNTTGDNYLTPKGYVDTKLDAKLNKSGGTLSGNLTMDGGNIYQKGNASRYYVRDNNNNTVMTIFGNGVVDSNEVFRCSKEDGLAFEARPKGLSNTFRVYAHGQVASDYVVTEEDKDTTLTTKKYVKDRISSDVKEATKNLISLEEGSYTVNKQWRLRGNIDAGGAWTFIHIGPNDDDEMGLYHLRDPIDGRHAAPRDYVDDAIVETLQAMSTALDSAGTVEQIKDGIRRVCAERIAHLKDPSRNRPEEEWNH